MTLSLYSIAELVLTPRMVDVEVAREIYARRPSSPCPWSDLTPVEQEEWIQMATTARQALTRHHMIGAVR